MRDELLKGGFVERGDYVVFTAGIPLMSKGTTNTIKVEQVD
ncbi:MAG: pyruvate kinase alpha/beta domain-containing protein [Bacteroidota bacterium]